MSTYDVKKARESAERSLAMGEDNAQDVLDAIAEVERRFTEDDVREAIRREWERWDSTITHPDAVDEVVARLREIQAERGR